MPKPHVGEKKSDYIKRCIPYVVSEKRQSGKIKPNEKVNTKQIYAICLGLWAKYKGAKGLDLFAQELLKKIKLMEENKKEFDKVDKEKFNKFGTN